MLVNRGKRAGLTLFHSYRNRLWLRGEVYPGREIQIFFFFFFAQKRERDPDPSDVQRMPPCLAVPRVPDRGS